MQSKIEISAMKMLNVHINRSEYNESGDYKYELAVREKKKREAGIHKVIEQKDTKAMLRGNKVGIMRQFRFSHQLFIRSKRGSVKF